MRRIKQQISESECVALLKSEKRGVLAVLGDEGYPYTVPLDYFYDEDNGKIYFHGAKEGHKVDAISKCDKVSFCVLGKDIFKEDDWAPFVTSVIVFGRIKAVSSREEALEKVRKIGLKYYPNPEDVENVLERTKDRVLCLELSIEHMTGKRVHEK